MNIHIYLSVSAHSEMEVFPANHQAPFSKMLTFYRKGPFELTAKYTDNSKVPHTDTCLGKFSSKNTHFKLFIHQILAKITNELCKVNNNVLANLN